MMRIALTLALLSSSVAGADTFKEPSTNHEFETTRMVDGRPFALLGAGVRKKFLVKVYAMALYADAAEARRAFPALAARAGGSDHAKLVASDHAQSFFLWGTFGKVGVMHFVRSVEGEKIREAFKEGFEDDLEGKSGPVQKAAAEQFVALFDKDIKDGQEIVLHSFPDGRLEVELAGEKRVGPQNPKLTRAVWEIWLGAKPISIDLRRELVDRIDLLAKP